MGDSEKAYMLLSGKCCGNCTFFRNEEALSDFYFSSQNGEKKCTFCYESSRKQTNRNWVCEKWQHHQLEWIKIYNSF